MLSGKIQFLSTTAKKKYMFPIFYLKEWGVAELEHKTRENTKNDDVSHVQADKFLLLNLEGFSFFSAFINWT